MDGGRNTGSEPHIQPEGLWAAAHTTVLAPLPQDYLIALSLQQQQPQGTVGLSDLELAQQLQQEEYQQQRGAQPVPARVPAPQVSLLQRPTPVTPLCPPARPHPEGPALAAPLPVQTPDCYSCSCVSRDPLGRPSAVCPSPRDPFLSLSPHCPS